MPGKIVLLDGAIGTCLWEMTSDRSPVWRFNIEKPELVSELCREYIKAGSRIVLSNTFGANRKAVSRSPYTVRRVVGEGVKIARDSARGTGAKVALSAGPLSELLEPYGELTENEAAAIYREQLGAGMEQGADLIFLETFMDIEMMRIAAGVAKEFAVPVFCLMTFEASGRTMMGNSVSDVIGTLGPLGVDAVGLNCSLGPEQAVPVIREFAEKTDIPLAFKPNAGKPVLAPGGKTVSPYNPELFAEKIRPALPCVSYLGGCCGSSPSHIAKLRSLLADEGRL